MRRLLIAMGIGMAIVFWVLLLSPEARIGNRNQRHVCLVQLGMSQPDALVSMGPPYDVSKYPVDGIM